ncbi:MAG: 30S ribosomal protein S4 [Desulfobacterales bacterium]|nr:30S ribosomal protein S4 [Desulfobacterales bacterium]
MARYIGAVCRLCRRENMKLFLKGDRCQSSKCAFEKHGYSPGQHGQRRGKFSDYGVQLREKQKVKRIYGMSEKQFRLFFYKAERQKGITGTNLLCLLERRLDNVVYRAGFAISRIQARQMVAHDCFLVNGRKANIPSFSVKIGDIVEVKETKRKIGIINESMETTARRIVPGWIDFDKQNYKAIIKVLPNREDITTPIQEQLIVELYSK